MFKKTGQSRNQRNKRQKTSEEADETVIIKVDRNKKRLVEELPKRKTTSVKLNEIPDRILTGEEAIQLVEKLQQTETKSEQVYSSEKQAAVDYIPLESKKINSTERLKESTTYFDDDGLIDMQMDIDDADLYETEINPLSPYTRHTRSIDESDDDSFPILTDINQILQRATLELQDAQHAHSLLVHEFENTKAILDSSLNMQDEIKEAERQHEFYKSFSEWADLLDFKLKRGGEGIIEEIVDRMNEWKSSCPEDYENAFGSQCFLSVLRPFVESHVKQCISNNQPVSLEALKYVQDSVTLEKTIEHMKSIVDSTDTSNYSHLHSLHSFLSLN